MPDNSKAQQTLGLIRDIDPEAIRLAFRFIELFNKPDSSVKELEEFVRSNDVLSLRVLKMVNTFATANAQHITTIDLAVGLVGYKGLREAVLSASSISILTGERGAIDTISFWTHAAACACIARALAIHCHHPHPEHGYMAGLLHDLGRRLLDVYASEGDEYQAVLDAMSSEEARALEKTLYGVDHCEIAEYAFKQWGVEPFLADAVGRHHMRAEEIKHSAITDRAVLTYAIIAIALAFHLLEDEEGGPLDQELLVLVGVSEAELPAILVRAREYFGSVRVNLESLRPQGAAGR